MSTFNVTLSEFIQFVMDKERWEQYHALPAQVQAYDAAKQVVDVKPMLKRISRTADDERIVSALPVLPAVPVAFPRGGHFYFRFPIAAGDSGLVIFCDADLGAWRDSGQDSDPGDSRVQDYNGAVFVPGLETVQRALAGTPDHLVLGYEGGAEIHIKPAMVELGAEGGGFVALAAKVNAIVTDIMTAISAASGAAGPLGTKGDAFALSLVSSQTPTPWGSVAATKVKAT